MGDANAVTLLEVAHRRQLINANVLTAETLLLPERPLPEGAEFGEVYIDDLVPFSIMHTSRLHQLRNCPRAKRAELMYRQLAMLTNPDKSETGLKDLWLSGVPDATAYGTDVRHRPPSTTGRDTWVSPTTPWVVEFCSQLQEGGALLFVCPLHVRQKVTHSHPPFPPAERSTTSSCWLLASLLFLQADQRAQLGHVLFATDASPSGAGACIAKVTSELFRWRI